MWGTAGSSRRRYAGTRTCAPARGRRDPAATQDFDVKPEYPQAALDAKITGVVIVEATIGVDGTTTDAHVLKSVPELDDAALAAVRQWR